MEELAKQIVFIDEGGHGRPPTLVVVLEVFVDKLVAEGVFLVRGMDIRP